MVVKYGKGYAMEETTLLTCNFWTGSEVIKSSRKGKNSGHFSLASVIQKEQEKQNNIEKMHKALYNTIRHLKLYFAVEPG
jgi:hypothetical protein